MFKVDSDTFVIRYPKDVPPAPLGFHLDKVAVWYPWGVGNRTEEFVIRSLFSAACYWLDHGGAASEDAAELQALAWDDASGNIQAVSVWDSDARAWGDWREYGGDKSLADVARACLDPEADEPAAVREWARAYLAAEVSAPPQP